MRPTKLQKTRRRLLDHQRQLADEINRTTEAVRDRAPGINEGDSTVPTHMADRDEGRIDSFIEVAQSLEQQMRAIDRAIEKIDDGSYGACESCGRRIAAERLEALPHAALCIDCAARDEQA